MYLSNRMKLALLQMQYVIGCTTKREYLSSD